jgi:purine-binding chemotaxis protein CheW
VDSIAAKEPVEGPGEIPNGNKCNARALNGNGMPPTCNPQPADRNRIVVFVLDMPQYALPLSAVKRVVRAVEILPFPKAPDIVLGMINVQGQVIPVVDVRKRFRLKSREMGLDDRFIIAQTSKRTVAVVVDSVVGIHELADGEMVAAGQILTFADYMQGVAKLEDGLVLICDLDKFLSLDEELALDDALSGGSK